MIPVSVVIITKNEAHIIGKTINKVKLFTDDIVVIDSGSTDSTIQLALDNGCRVYQERWHGYAANKNKGIALAKYNWILSLDADEIPDDELIAGLHHVLLNDAEKVYDIKFKSYFGEQQIHFGKWGRDHHIRLFNRTHVTWCYSSVHETLALTRNTKLGYLKGNIHHYSVTDLVDLETKSEQYAMLSARQYFQSGKKATATKRYLSPIFNFVKNYIFFLGFLDGHYGWIIAHTTFKHTILKYALLNKMQPVMPSQNIYIANNYPLIIDGNKIYS